MYHVAFDHQEHSAFGLTFHLFIYLFIYFILFIYLFYFIHLFYVMLCYVMLCYVMLCYVMLCYVMLFFYLICRFLEPPRYFLLSRAFQSWKMPVRKEQKSLLENPFNLNLTN